MKAHLQQLRALKVAYETVTPEDSYLPSKESPIPALLALRVTDRCISETKDCIASTTVNLNKLQKRLEAEQSALRDAQLVQNGLEDRITSLEEEIEARTQRTPDQIGKEMLREMRAEKKHYEEETVNLVQDFNDFVDEYLSSMLAAEELGGPIVGGILDVDDEMLGAGFSAQGKARKPKAVVNEGKRQRRIDEIWGPRPADDEEEAEEPWNEQQAAAAEMRALTEQLLNSLVGAGGNGPGAYVELPRESAAARFLVRAKVGQFHPKDSRKLRLIDFGGEIAD